MTLLHLRKIYHQGIFDKIVHIDEHGVPNFADKSSEISSKIAYEIVRILSYQTAKHSPSGQQKGRIFELLTAEFLRKALALLSPLRPGKWEIMTEQTKISQFEQYQHLEQLKELIHKNPDLATVVGGDYIITPDIVVARHPLTKDEIHEIRQDNISQLTPLCSNNRQQPALLLHASISCKWTIRSDRAQNTRTEALNLIRNRKGHTPHIVAITAEPYPSRIASLALGTGDLDYVYHFALHELLQATESVDNEQYQLLLNLVNGRRLRDISDLPFDLIA